MECRKMAEIIKEMLSISTMLEDDTSFEIKPYGNQLFIETEGKRFCIEVTESNNKKMHNEKMFVETEENHYHVEINEDDEE